jgi:origin recognition complex subunit 3
MGDSDDDDEDDEDDEDSLFQSGHPDAFVTHLHPSECTSVMLAMKTLVGGFVQRSPDKKHGRYPQISIT